MLGHANAKINWNTYNRYIPNLTRDDGSAFEAMMNSKKVGHTVPKMREKEGK